MDLRHVWVAFKYKQVLKARNPTERSPVHHNRRKFRICSMLYDKRTSFWRTESDQIFPSEEILDREQRKYQMPETALIELWRLTYIALYLPYRYSQMTELYCLGVHLCREQGFNREAGIGGRLSWSLRPQILTTIIRNLSSRKDLIIEEILHNCSIVTEVVQQCYR